MNAVDELSALPKWTQSPSEELANSISHGIGFVAALIGASILLSPGRNLSSIGFYIGVIVFTLTTLLLYLASMLYHAWPQTRGKSLLQLLDHCAIFWLIAGTYTPFMLGPLHGAWGWTILGLIWACAVFGTLVKATRGTTRHRKLAMLLYLGMGWFALIATRPFALALPVSTLLWLLAGGVAYTVGVLFFVKEQLRYSHFIWHLFVLAGSSCHFAAVFTCTV